MQERTLIAIGEIRLTRKEMNLQLMERIMCQRQYDFLVSGKRDASLSMAEQKLANFCLKYVAL